MDICLSYSKSSLLTSFQTLDGSSSKRSFPSRRLAVRAAFSAGVNCGFGGSLNAPLEPKSAPGRLLGGVLLNEPDGFHAAVGRQLGELVDCRNQTAARMALSLGSDEAVLHRRIAQLKERECETALEDILYMLIFYRFSDIRVQLVPRFSECIYKGRLEVFPAKDWELESIHSYEVLEMIREHLTSVVGWKANSGVSENWATTCVERLHLYRIYVASILYGYFLKSASLRHHLELSLDQIKGDNLLSTDSSLRLLELSHGITNAVLGHTGRTRSTSIGQVPLNCIKKQERLRYYITSFDPETLRRCARPKSKAALNLIEEHSAALFGHQKEGSPDMESMICTSMASLKRLVLEAIAFGSFLWDAEEYVNSIYRLEEN